MSDAATVIAKPSLTLQRRFAATPAQVYAAWTDPKKIVQWFGPAETKTDSVEVIEMDVREGGRFNISFSTQDGEFHRVSGVYKEVVPDAKLVFSWAWYTMPERESQVTRTLKPEGANTLLTLTHEQFFNEAARDGHRHGWTGTLDKLAAWLAP